MSSPTPAHGPATPELLTDVERSAGILRAAGFRTLTVSGQLGSWQLLAISPQGRLLLIATCRGNWPNDRGRFATPAYFPSTTTKLLHKWTDGEPYPAVLHIT